MGSYGLVLGFQLCLSLFCPGLEKKFAFKVQPGWFYWAWFWR